MFTAAVALLATALAAEPAPPPQAYAMPGLNCVNFDDKSCTFFGEYLAERLQEGGGIEITTQAEIAAVLGMERQKALLGCSMRTAAAWRSSPARSAAMR